MRARGAYARTGWKPRLRRGPPVRCRSSFRARVERPGEPISHASVRCFKAPRATGLRSSDRFEHLNLDEFVDDALAVLNATEHGARGHSLSMSTRRESSHWHAPERGPSRRSDAPSRRARPPRHSLADGFETSTAGRGSKRASHWRDFATSSSSSPSCQSALRRRAQQPRRLGPASDLKRSSQASAT